MIEYEYHRVDFKDFELYESVGQIPNIFDIEEKLKYYSKQKGANTFALQDFKIDLALDVVSIGVIFYYE